MGPGELRAHLGLDRVGRHVGFIEHDVAATDLTFVACGIIAGMLLGMLKFNAGGIVLGLGTAGSILVVGLVAGWARSRYPVFGAIPEPAQRLRAVTLPYVLRRPKTDPPLTDDRPDTLEITPSRPLTP